MRFLTVLAVLCLILTGTLFASTVLTQVIAGGTMTLSYPSDITLGGVTIGGASSITSNNNMGTYTVEDARGTQAGWNLGFNIGQFTTSGTPARTIPVAGFNMSITSGNITLVFGQAIDATGGPKSLYTSNYNVQATEIKFVTAGDGYGAGKYNMSTEHALSVPAAAYAGTYTATLTATLNTAP